jgi:hypothetical protein
LVCFLCVMPTVVTNSFFLIQNLQCTLFKKEMRTKFVHCWSLITIAATHYVACVKNEKPNVVRDDNSGSVFG